MIRSDLIARFFPKLSLSFLLSFPRFRLSSKNSLLSLNIFYWAQSLLHLLTEWINKLVNHSKATWTKKNLFIRAFETLVFFFVLAWKFMKRDFFNRVELFWVCFISISQKREILCFISYKLDLSKSLVQHEETLNN